MTRALAIRGQRVGLPRMAATLLAENLTEWESNLAVGRLRRLRPVVGFSSIPSGKPPSYSLWVPQRDLARAKEAIIGDRVIVRRHHYVPDTNVLLLSRPTKMPGPSWSLPAANACPYMFIDGPNTICGSCYALTGRYVDDDHVAAMAARFDWVRECLKTADGTLKFIDEMVSAIRDAGHTYFRVHDSGDLFSRAYTLAWREVAAELSKVHFWVPTRSWRAPWIEAIVALNELPNVAARPSALNFEDPPPMIAGLSAGSSATRTDDYTCPAPRQGHRCGECRVCWDEPDRTVIFKETGFSRRPSLPMLGVPPMPTATNGHSTNGNGHHPTGLLADELARMPDLHAAAIDLPVLPPPRPAAVMQSNTVLAPIINMDTWVSATRTMVLELTAEKESIAVEIARLQARCDEIDQLQAPMRQMLHTVDEGIIRTLTDLDPTLAKGHAAREPATWPVRLPPPQVIIQQAAAPSAAAAGPARQVRRWSRDYDACQECGKTSGKHASGGLCAKCYNRARSRRQRTNARGALG